MRKGLNLKRQSFAKRWCGDLPTADQSNHSAGLAYEINELKNNYLDIKIKVGKSAFIFPDQSVNHLIWNFL